MILGKVSIYGVKVLWCDDKTLAKEDIVIYKKVTAVLCHDLESNPSN